MINKLSLYLADKLFSSKDETEEERELYVYGLFMLLSHFTYLVLVLLFGCILKCVIESIIFYFAFYQLRRYAGGYHAKTELRCEISSTLLMLLSLITIKASIYYDFRILMALSAVSTVAIFVVAPIDTPEKPLSEKEFMFFRKRTRISLIIIFLIAIVSFIFKINVLFLPCCVGIVAESILIVAGQIKKIKNT